MYNSVRIALDNSRLADAKVLVIEPGTSIELAMIPKVIADKQERAEFYRRILEEGRIKEHELTRLEKLERVDEATWNAQNAARQGGPDAPQSMPEEQPAAV